jgi:hypothetical protein
MRELLGLVFSVALPWIAGTLWIRAVLRQDAPYRTSIAVGYGYLVGLFGVTVSMRLLDLIGQRWSVLWIALPIVALAAAAGWRIRGSPGWRISWTLSDPFAAVPPGTRSLFAVLIVLTSVRVLVLGVEILASPLVPFDALAHWASKSRVWFEFGRMTPFVTLAEWTNAVGTMHFTDTHPGYPGTVPLFQVWTALCLGRWDESFINLPWLFAFVTLGIAFYAQLRRLGISALKSMFGTYVLLSLPYVTIHVALAGIADLFVAIAYGLAAISLWQWTITRGRDDAILAVAMAIVCLSLKFEGFVWVATLAAGAVVAVNRRAGLAMVVAVAVASVAYLLFGPAQLRILDFVLFTRFENVSPEIYEHLFVMDNWHLLWYAAVAVLVVNTRLIVGPALAPMTVTMLAAFTFVFALYYFSSAMGGVKDNSLTNRIPLQIVTAFLFYLALILRERASQHPTKTAAL